MTRALICGGRDFADVNFIWKELDRLRKERGITSVIHGGARGADSLANDWAIVRSLDCKEFKADWKTHGRSAGAIRNRQMLSEGKPDVVIAFPGGRGTADMVRVATKNGVPVIELKR